MKKVFQFGSAVALSLSGCIKEPESCLTLDKTNIVVGEVVTATNCSDADVTTFWLSEPTGFSMDDMNRASGTYLGDSIATKTGQRTTNCSSDANSVTYTFQVPGTYYIVHEAVNYRGKCKEDGGNTFQRVNSYQQVTVN